MNKDVKHNHHNVSILLTLTTGLFNTVNTPNTNDIMIIFFVGSFSLIKIATSSIGIEVTIQ